MHQQLAVSASAPLPLPCVAPKCRSRIQEDGLHLVLQGAVDVLNLNATLHKPVISGKGQSALFMFSNDQIECTLDGFRFGIGPQQFLRALNLDRV